MNAGFSEHQASALQLAEGPGEEASCNQCSARLRRAPSFAPSGVSKAGEAKGATPSPVEAMESDVASRPPASGERSEPDHPQRREVSDGAAGANLPARRRARIACPRGLMDTGHRCEHGESSVVDRRCPGTSKRKGAISGQRRVVGLEIGSLDPPRLTAHRHVSRPLKAGG